MTVANNRWFINETGDAYAYNRLRQEKDYPNDYHMAFETEDDAKLVSDLIAALIEMTEMAAYAMDVLSGSDAEEAEKFIEQAKVLVAKMRPNGPNLVIPTEELVGKVAKVRLNEEDGRTYIAEVRKDFGGLAWAGSWHGFTLAKGKPIDVIEWLT